MCLFVAKPHLRLITCCNHFQGWGILEGNIKPRVGADANPGLIDLNPFRIFSGQSPLAVAAVFKTICVYRRVSAVKSSRLDGVSPHRGFVLYVIFAVKLNPFSAI